MNECSLGVGARAGSLRERNTVRPGVFVLPSRKPGRFSSQKEIGFRYNGIFRDRP